RSNFLDLENDVIWVFCVNAWKDRRMRVRIMSICFTWFPIGGLGKFKTYQNLVDFTIMWEFYLEGV
ncbi:uncharacterized protein METZ01_LOCUS79592, partial [marine metagenome]